jgi:mRNA interferase MazF
VIAQGDIWLMMPTNGKQRPVLIVSRDEAIPVLNNIVVAPITSTIRNIPTNIVLGPTDGIDHESAASFDNLSTVPKSVLTRRLGQIDEVRRSEICRALEAMADCP